MPYYKQTGFTSEDTGNPQSSIHGLLPVTTPNWQLLLLVPLPLPNIQLDKPGPNVLMRDAYHGCDAGGCPGCKIIGGCVAAGDNFFINTTISIIAIIAPPAISDHLRIGFIGVAAI